MPDEKDETQGAETMPDAAHDEHKVEAEPVKMKTIYNPSSVKVELAFADGVQKFPPGVHTEVPADMQIPSKSGLVTMMK